MTPSPTRSPITTHVLDLARGKAAAHIAVVLEHQAGTDWKKLGSAHTNADGRAENLLPPGTSVESGVYRLRFNTGQYFDDLRVAHFYPEVIIVFDLAHTTEHYHVPLLLSPFGYSTYRGT
jgi:5-hydroxyisourate hydrolase